MGNVFLWIPDALEINARARMPPCLNHGLNGLCGRRGLISELTSGGIIREIQQSDQGNG